MFKFIDQKPILPWAGHTLLPFFLGQIRPEDSLFTYPEGKTASDFAHPEHMPVFLDEVVAAADQDIISACDGDRECIFDTCQTGDLSIGLDTKATDEQIIDDQNQASEF